MNRRQRRRRARNRRLAVVLPLIVLAVAWTAGMLMPPRRVETVQAVVAAPPEAVFGILADVDGMPDWRADVRAVERLPNGPGAIRWRETGPRGGSLALELAESVPPVRLVIQPAADSRDRRWVYRLSPADGAGTLLEVREERQIVNPLGRALAGVIGFDRSRIARLVRDVERRVLSRRGQVAAR